MPDVPNTECEFCHGTREAAVLDVWGIARSKATTGHMPSFDGAGSLPMIAAPCPKCVGEAEFDAAIQAMNERWGSAYSAAGPRGCAAEDGATERTLRSFT